ncbi:response regulator transcription factor [Streptomyces asiaticus]
MALTAGFGDREPTRLLAVTPSHWPGIVRIALRGGDPSVAEAVSGALRSLTARDDSQRIIRAVRAHVDGLLHGDPRGLESAISLYGSGGRPLALAAACEDLGELLATSADMAPAIPYLEEAGELASASGALRDHERIRQRRAIADRLYVSIHTVNTHMKHIFTKLGINTRVELTRLALERGGPADGAD